MNLQIPRVIKTAPISLFRILILSVFLFSLTAPANAATTAFVQYLISIPNQISDQTSTLFLHNQAGVQAALNLDFVNQAGQSITVVSDTIPANATIERPLAQVTGLPSGNFTVVISSDQPVQSLAQVMNTSKDSVGVVLGQTENTGEGFALVTTVAATRASYGPFYDTSTLSLFNPGNSFVTLVVDFYNSNGSVATTHSDTIGPNNTLSLSSANIYPQLSAGVYHAVVSSDGGLIGVLKNRLYGQSDYELQTSLNAGNMTASFVRAFKHFNNGGGDRSSQLFIANLSPTVSSANLTYTNSNQVFHHDGIPLAPEGFAMIDLTAESTLPSGSVWAVSVTSDQLVGLGEVNTSDTPPSLTSIGSYPGTPVNGGSVYKLDFAYLNHQANNYSAFFVQNLSPNQANILIEYYNLAGSMVLNQTDSITANSSKNYNLTSIPQLGSNYQGWARVNSDQPIAGIADLFVQACTPPGGVLIIQEPAGSLFAGDTAEFSVAPTGKTPFSYAWTLDGNTVGSNLNSYSHLFATPGDLTVGVDVSNSCGQASDTLVVNVKAKMPDLTTSFIAVNHSNITGLPDTLTYTLWLRNTGLAAAAASLENPIPAHTSYIPGSALTNDGSQIQVENGNLLWSGPVSLENPVIIEYQVLVEDPQPITNTAVLHDGAGNDLSLEVVSTYNPGFSLSINNGDLYTNQNAVKLTYGWDTSKNITQYRLSNDGGFGVGTSAWMAVNLANPTFTGWVLKSLPNSIISRNVYIQFRDGSGQPNGTYQDDIIFDSTPPEITHVEIIPEPTLQNAFPKLASSVIVRVTSSDNTSGVSLIQISHKPDFGQFSTYSSAGGVTDIHWDLQPSGLVYVRVVDQAGNLSAVDDVAGPVSQQRVYLPVVTR